MDNKVVSFKSKLRSTEKVNNLSLDTLLKDWQIWMAIEVIEQWKSYDRVRLNLVNTLDDLDVTKNNDFAVLLEQIKAQIQNDKKLDVSIKKIEEYRISFEEYFLSDVEQKIQNSSYVLRKSTITSFNSVISFDCQKASPENLLILFNALSDSLCIQKINFDEQRTKYLKKENSVWRAYFRLLDKLDNCVIDSFEYKAIVESIWNAIIIGFEAKFNIEKYTAYSYIVQSLIQLCQHHHNSANRSLKLLNLIQRSLKNKFNEDSLSLPVFGNLKRIDISTQRNLIEIWLGHSLNFWSNTSVTWQNIEAKLLENIEPVILELYEDFYNCFLSSEKITKNIDRI